jgi:hypothetical protein
MEVVSIAWWDLDLVSLRIMVSWDNQPVRFPIDRSPGYLMDFKGQYATENLDGFILSAYHTLSSLSWMRIPVWSSSTHKEGEAFWPDRRVAGSLSVDFENQMLAELVPLASIVKGV